MLRTHTHTVSPAVLTLIGVTVVLLVVLGVFLYLRTLPQEIAVPLPEKIPVQVTAAPLPVVRALPSAPAAARHIVRSETTLKRWLDDAYEQRDEALVQELLKTINGRYERRCCGLPY